MVLAERGACAAWQGVRTLVFGAKLCPFHAQVHRAGLCTNGIANDTRLAYGHNTTCLAYCLLRSGQFCAVGLCRFCCTGVLAGRRPRQACSKPPEHPGALAKCVRASARHMARKFALLGAESLAVAQGSAAVLSLALAGAWLAARRAAPCLCKQESSNGSCHRATCKSVACPSAKAKGFVVQVVLTGPGRGLA